MTNISIDVKKINDAGKDIVNLSFEFVNLINGFYKRVNDIPTVTGEWIGAEASEFSKISMTEKENYVKFANSLKSLGSSLTNFSEQLDDRVKKIEDEL